MSDLQAAGPDAGNLQAGGAAGEAGSILTAEAKAAEGTTSLTQGATKAPPLWMAQLPPDLKADQSLTKFATIGDLGKSYKELEGRLGTAVVLPDEKASAEEWARYRKAVGVPEKPEDYKLEKVQLPDGIAKDEKAEAAYLALAHKLNMTNEQAKSVHQWYYQNLAEAMRVVKTTMDEAEALMAKEFGADWPAAKEYMNRGLAQFADPETVKFFERTGLGNHSGMIRMFIKMGKTISEHPFVEGENKLKESNPVGQRTDGELAEVLYPPKE